MAIKRNGPGLYLETETGPNITVILVHKDGTQQRLPDVTPAEDLLKAMDVDYTAYRREIKKLREEHPLFEERLDVSVRDYVDLVTEALGLPELLREQDPVAYFVLSYRLNAALTIPDDGTALFLLHHGMRLVKILEEPILTQIRLRNIFEMAFAGMERATQQERYARLQAAYPMVLGHHFLSRRLEAPESAIPLSGPMEYMVGSLYELRLLELSLYFQQEA